MAIDFNKTFGTNKPATTSNTDKPKAQFWLNIGYDSGVQDEHGNSRFINLPQGIPLDSQDHLPTNSRNNEFAAMQSARNDLLDQILEHAKTLKPGEECMLNLQIQLRRVNEDQGPIPADANPFARKITL